MLMRMLLHAADERRIAHREQAADGDGRRGVAAAGVCYRRQ